MIGYAPGVTSKSVVIQVVDDSGLAVPALVAATMPAIYYWIAGANAGVAITLSDLSTITTAWASGGVKEIDATHLAGYYRLDVPDAAWSAAGKVKIGGEASGKHVLCEVVDVGYPQVDFRQIIGSTLTETTGGNLAAAFKKFLDVATPKTTLNSILPSWLTLTGATSPVTADTYTPGGIFAGLTYYQSTTLGTQMFIWSNGSGYTISTVLGTNGSNFFTSATPAGNYTAAGGASGTPTALLGGGGVLSPFGLDQIVVENGLNHRQSLSLITAILAGVLTGGGTTTITILGAGVGTTRIVATVDSSGNRSAVTLTPPA